jgi:hypothetical protein
MTRSLQGSRKHVRRQINMDRLQPEGMEALAHLGFHFKRQACDDASVGF